MIKFVDLFSGTGGIRLGFEQAMSEIGVSTECIKSSEIDKKSCETYQLNFNEDSYCDVHDVDIDGHFDVLLAGFPCQAFSYAGKQLGFSDTRGTLFFEIERIIKKNKPKLCLLENVRGLTTHDKGRTFSTILKSLQKIFCMKVLFYNEEFHQAFHLNISSSFLGLKTSLIFTFSDLFLTT